MKIQTVYQDAQGKTIGEHIQEFGDEAWAFDDVGGYIVDDIISLAVGASFTIRRKE